ncbi:MAG: heme exporter protein CcmB, partial [Proteobacteria bacterium]|nr:heme exporter protein CcmB [Pseudomonadota bacterium]
GPEPGLLLNIGVGAIWTSALLASILALGELFGSDDRDGVLEQMILVPEPLEVIVLARIFSHWIITGLPIVLVSPFLGIFFGFSWEVTSMLVLALFLGTPILSLIGAMGAALTLGVRGATALAALLILPLYVPVLIFGSLATNSALLGTESESHLSLLFAILMLSLVISPLAVAASLRAALD